MLFASGWGCSGCRQEMKNCGPFLFIYFFLLREIIKFLWFWFCICKTRTVFWYLHLRNVKCDGSAAFVYVRLWLYVGGYIAVLISQGPNKTSTATGRKYRPQVLSPTGQSSCVPPPAGDTLTAAESLECFMKGLGSLCQWTTWTCRFARPVGAGSAESKSGS